MGRDYYSISNTIMSNEDDASTASAGDNAESEIESANEKRRESANGCSEKTNQVQLWPNLSSFYKQKFFEDASGSGNFLFECLSCRPTLKNISTSISSNSNLRTHIKVSLLLIQLNRLYINISVEHLK